MRKKELIKSVVVAGAVFAASTMLFGCAYGPQPMFIPDPATAVTAEEVVAIGLDDTVFENIESVNGETDTYVG